MIDAIIVTVEYVAGVLGIPVLLVHAVAVVAVLSAGCLGVIGKERRKRLMQALRKVGGRLRDKGGTAAALMLAVALGGCVLFDAPSEGRLAAACQAYADTLSALAEIKPQLSDSQIAIINDARSVATPICERGPDYGDAAAAGKVAVVSRAVSDMTTVESEVNQ